MRIRRLSIAGAAVLSTTRHRDARGELLEWFAADQLTAALGRPLTVAQANMSVSRRGVLRGLHVSEVPPGQGKLVTCPSGAVMDVLVDLRTGSDTFGQHEQITLDQTDRLAVWVPEGVGHAFCALVDDATVVYLCTSAYNAAREHVVHPLSIGIRWPFPEADLVMSERDATAPTLADAAAAGRLPSFGVCRDLGLTGPPPSSTT